ncbi:MAG: hypothetical protein D6737_18295 [Chloroflexi bacterium]|nr:MAG: hypothetical protein CUN54_07905 [Phototrophicales bacterium]RMF77242.1 MAG: hypothetical protein D6737_18295 [Chloroflexota bacterium]
MPFEVSWYLENRVVLVQPKGMMASADMAEMNTEILKLIHAGRDAGTDKVHTIIDVRALQRMPVNISGLSDTLKHVKDPAQGWIIMVGAKSSIRFLARIVSQIARADFCAVETFDDGIATLQRLDASLPKLTPQKVEC